MVGLFINTVPVRLRLDPDEATVDVLARWQSEQSALLEHQYVGLGELRRVTGLQELFQTLVVVENYPIGDTAITDPSGTLSLTGIRFDEHPPYPLTLIAVPGDELRLEVKYDAARVSDATAAQMADGMLTILAVFRRRWTGRLRRSNSPAPPSASTSSTRSTSRRPP